jgi:hypothetical protein
MVNKEKRKKKKLILESFNNIIEAPEFVIVIFLDLTKQE